MQMFLCWPSATVLMPSLNHTVVTHGHQSTAAILESYQAVRGTRSRYVV